MAPRRSGAILGAAVPPNLHGHTEAPRKALFYSESSGQTSPTPSTMAKAHPSRGLFLLGGFAAPTFGCLFLGAAVPATPRGHTEVPSKASPHSESGGRTSPAPPTKAIAHPSRGPWGLFGTPTIGCLFSGAAVPVTPRGHSEVPGKGSSHFESDGRTSPTPPTKAIGLPSRAAGAFLGP